MSRKLQNAAGASQSRNNSDDEGWLFAQSITGKEVRYATRAENEAAWAREQLEFLASFSTKHAEILREVQRREAVARERRDYEARLAHHLSICEYQWDSALHPRIGGPPNPGWFAAKDGGGGGGGGSGKAPKKDTQPQSAKTTLVPATKTHLPAAHRGEWIKGTRGDGTFRYNRSAENIEAGVAGKEIRFVDQHIAIGGFPPEAYYGGSAKQAGVQIETVKGTTADSTAADAAMRRKLGNPAWERPDTHRWNHAGGPGSKAMELVDVNFHEAVAHKGPGAVLRAATRLARAGKATGRAFGALSVYLAVRDTLQIAGALKPDYEVMASEVYHFREEDGSVFTVTPGRFYGGTRHYVDGPRKGQSESITTAEVAQLRQQAEAEFGKYISGSLIREPRFIPGKQRDSIPYYTEREGVKIHTGWIDATGVHIFQHFIDDPNLIII